MTPHDHREAISSERLGLRGSSTRRQGALLLGGALLCGGCRERARALPVEGARDSRGLAAEAAPASTPTFAERVPAPDPLRALAAPDAPNQRVAFSRGRLAWLRSDELWVVSLPDFALAAHFRAPGARNVVGLTGGGFLIAADDVLLRLSPLEHRPEALPRAPRLGPTTIIPSRIESEQFWLYYAGIAELPRFDLGGEPRIASLPMLDWTELVDFDRRALLGLGDGSFVYTTAEGLRRIDVEGRRERLPQAELAGRVWALGRDRRLDRVWAVTEQHLYLVHVRDEARVLQRFELGPHPVALAAEGGTAAVLRVESLGTASARTVVEVFVDGRAPPRVIRLDPDAATPGDAGLPARFLPELALSVGDGLIAAAGFGLQVHDYRRGVRVYSEEVVAQKLAPAAP